jgi:hypothetical protein
MVSYPFGQLSDLVREFQCLTEIVEFERLFEMVLLDDAPSRLELSMQTRKCFPF